MNRFVAQNTQDCVQRARSGAAQSTDSVQVGGNCASDCVTTSHFNQSGRKRTAIRTVEPHNGPNLAVSSDGCRACADVSSMNKHDDQDSPPCSKKRVLPPACMSNDEIASKPNEASCLPHRRSRQPRNCSSVYGRNANQPVVQPTPSVSKMRAAPRPAFEMPAGASLADLVQLIKNNASAEIVSSSSTCLQDHPCTDKPSKPARNRLNEVVRKPNAKTTSSVPATSIPVPYGVQASAWREVDVKIEQWLSTTSKAFTDMQTCGFCGSTHLGGGGRKMNSVKETHAPYALSNSVMSRFTRASDCSVYQCNACWLQRKRESTQRWDHNVVHSQPYLQTLMCISPLHAHMLSCLDINFDFKLRCHAYAKGQLVQPSLLQDPLVLSGTVPGFSPAHLVSWPPNAATTSTPEVIAQETRSHGIIEQLLAAGEDAVYSSCFENRFNEADFQLLILQDACFRRRHNIATSGKYENNRSQRLQ